MARVFIGVDPHKLSATIEVVDDARRSWRPGGSPRTRPGTRRCDDTSPGTPIGRGRWREATAPGGRWRNGSWPTGSTSWTSRRSCQPGPGRWTPGTTARPTRTTRTPLPSSRCAPCSSGAGRLRAARGAAVAGRPARRAGSRARIQTVNRVHRLLAELVPGQSESDITTGQATTILATVKPRDVAGKTRRRLAAEQITPSPSRRSSGG